MKKGILGKVLLALLVIGVLASIVYSVVVNHVSKPKYDKDNLQVNISTGYGNEGSEEDESVLTESYSDAIEDSDEEIEVVGMSQSDISESIEGYEEISETDSSSEGLTKEEINELLSFNLDNLVSNNKISLADASEYKYGDENFDGATNIVGKTDTVYYNAEDDEYMCFFFVNADNCAVSSENGVIFIKMNNGIISKITRVVINVNWSYE